MDAPVDVKLAVAGAVDLVLVQVVPVPVRALVKLNALGARDRARGAAKAVVAAIALEIAPDKA